MNQLQPAQKKQKKTTFFFAGPLFSHHQWLNRFFSHSLGQNGTFDTRPSKDLPRCLRSKISLARRPKVQGHPAQQDVSRVIPAQPAYQVRKAW
jgi:hypothetical protein